MRILLDHCVSSRFGKELPMHDVHVAAAMGWAAYSNGRLIEEAAAGGFEVLLTVDKSLRFQQNLATLPLTIVEMNTRDARWARLQSMAPHVIRALEVAVVYRCLVVYEDGRIERFAPRA